MFKAEILCDSINASTQDRITTFVLCYPRFIHAEFMTHRVFSRNASSSRAIPVQKMLAQVEHSPARPVHWGKNQSGMQAHEEVSRSTREKAQAVWEFAARAAVAAAEDLMKLGIHKQVSNRLLEPFQWITVVVTSTEWTNFFELRCHPDAQPEIRHLAEMMKDAYDRGSPRYLNPGQWHLPFLTHEDYQQAQFRTTGMDDLIAASVARCARVSYLRHDGEKPSLENDLALYERLVGSRPIHASPTEHQAMALSNWDGALRRDLTKNFNGWMPHRTEVETPEFRKWRIRETARANA